MSARTLVPALVVGGALFLAWPNTQPAVPSQPAAATPESVPDAPGAAQDVTTTLDDQRSEERRGGKECA